ncbi:Mediator of RNA polymerase II transcription subunit 6 [Allomyces arbusculus]|nr:Mediator of RNA polymerase II transcription subunit 6 [Allomyces arbusculus]
MADKNAPEQEDRTDLVFRAPQFLEFHGGGIPTPQHALEYISLAPDVYDQACLNETIKMQTQYSAIASESLDTSKMTGPEYCIWYHDVMGQNFHILKHYKHSPTQYTPLAGYYILQGDLYQAPDLYSLLTLRLRNFLSAMNDAFSAFSNHVHFHPAQGYMWETATATAGPDVGAGDGTSTKGPASKGPGTTAKSATSRATKKSKKAQPTPEQQEHLMNAQFMERVDMLIYQSAQRQHVSLVEKPATPPPEKAAASEAVAGGPRDTPDISLAGSVVGKKRRPKRDRDSDTGSVGGDSTVSRKRKKVKKEKRV